MKAKLIEFIKSLLVIIITLIVGAYLYHSIYAAKKMKELEREKTSAQNALELSGQNVQVHTEPTGQIVHSVETIEATPETVNHLPESNELKRIAGKLNRLQAFVNSKFQAQDTFTAIQRDTVIIHDSITPPAKTFSYSDGFLSLQCLGMVDTLQCGYTYSDSVGVIIYRKPLFKWYTFWKWGKYENKTEIRFKNPSCSAKWIESVILKQ